MDEKPSIPGHERLTMSDQMRAQSVSPELHTSPTTGAVENPRREYLKHRIESRSQQAAVHAQNSVAWADGTSG